MQINKKILSIAVTALLLLSMLAAAAPAFAITADPVATPASGPVGTKVTITGAGAEPYETVEAHWLTLSGPLMGKADAMANGSFVIKNVVIPSAVNGENTIVLTDGKTTNRGVIFTVEASLKTNVDRALPGDSITLTGHGFSKTSDITIKFDGLAGTIPLTSPTITTNATGSFSAVVTVPISIDDAFGTYTITATDEQNVTTYLTIGVDYYIIVTPESGPTGITVDVEGRIPSNEAFTVTFGGVTAFTGTSSSIGAFSGTYTLSGPIAHGTSYEVKIVYAAGAYETATFTGTAPPELVSYTTVQDVAGKVVTISGTGFSSKANICVYIGDELVNATDLDDRFGPTDASGEFDNLEFTIPALSPGNYILKVVDEYGASTGATYAIVIKSAPSTTIALRSDAYAQGDTLSFNIVTTEDSLNTITVTIRDPSKVTWWTTNTWSLTGTGTQRVMYQNQLINDNPIALPADAPTGTWNWTVTYTPTSTNVLTRATGVFDVVAAGSTAVIDAINELKGTIETIQGDVVVIKTSVGTSLSTTVSAIQGKVTSIENGLATLSIPDLGAITTKLSSIDAVLGSVAGDVVTLKTSIGDVTTTLSALNANVVSIEGNVATIQTDVGTLQGVVTQVKDGVATISTGIGNIQTSVTNLQPDVVAAKDNSASISTMVYVAVAFAIIAAIAAVASILLMRKKIAS